MSVVSIAIVGRQDEPLYMKEFPTKYWYNRNPHAESEEELFGLSLSDEESPARDTSSGEGNFGCSLKQQFILHSMLDRFTQLAGPPPGFGWRTPGTTGCDAMFAGLLAPVEDYRVYGYMTTTKIKIIAVIEDDESATSSDERVKALLAEIHRHYVEYTMNPFAKVGAPIESKRFNASIQHEIDTYNRTI